MRHTLQLVAVLFAAMLGFSVSAEEGKKDAKPFDDAEFVTKAGSCGIHEVELAKIGVEKAKTDGVKKFAQQLIDDHTKANEALLIAAKLADLKVPTKMTDEQQKEVEKFKAYKGDNFDRDFIKHQVKDHEEAVNLLTRASKEAKQPAIKAFAVKVLPIIQGHLETAKKLQEQVK